MLDMKTYKKVILMITIPLIIISTCVLGLYWWRTDVSVNPSPTGEYSIKMYWTDVGGWGWRGKVYLVEHGFFDRKYWTGYYVPASSKWVSDYEFELTYRSFNLPPVTEKHVFSVHDFIQEK